MYSDMIRMGLGVRIVGSTQIKTVMRSKLRWAGLIEVNPENGLCPNKPSTTGSSGTFITKTDPKVWAALRVDSRGRGRLRGKAQAGRKLVMPIGTVRTGTWDEPSKVPVEKMVELGTS